MVKVLFDSTIVAIGRIGDRRGYPLDTTTSEIVSEIKAFAPDVLEE